MPLKCILAASMHIRVMEAMHSFVKKLNQINLIAFEFCRKSRPQLSRLYGIYTRKGGKSKSGSFPRCSDHILPHFGHLFPCRHWHFDRHKYEWRFGQPTKVHSRRHHRGPIDHFIHLFFTCPRFWRRNKPRIASGQVSFEFTYYFSININSINFNI
jgi:hypothetical protein